MGKLIVEDYDRSDKVINCALELSNKWLDKFDAKLDFKVDFDDVDYNEVESGVSSFTFRHK